MKLDMQHKHIMRLIKRDRDSEGWATVSDVLFPILSVNMPGEFVEFVPAAIGGKAKLTEKGENVLEALEWIDHQT